MICSYCQNIISSWDEVPNHKCFINKYVYMDEDNWLFAESSPENNQSTHTFCNDTVDESYTSEKENIIGSLSKQTAVWNKQSALALLNLYEINLSKADNPKKKTKLWTAITEGLHELGIKMTSDQVRWKINSLIKRYKECVDNNKKSGRANMTFEFYDQLEEILGQGKEATALHTVSSKIILSDSDSNDKKEKVEKPRKKQKKDNNNDQPSTSAIKNESQSVVKSLRPGHGTGSNVAKMKAELQTQWLDYLTTSKNREEEQTKRHEKLLQNKMEVINVKKRQLDLKKQIAEKKLKSKERRHEEIIEVERSKIDLLKKLLRSDKNIEQDSDSE